jgi:Domain of unknown function (DUF5679)
MARTSDRRMPAADRPSTGKGDAKRIAKERAALQARLAAADELVARRTTQLREASAERSALAAKLARLSSTPGGTEVTAYCLRERRRVELGDWQAVTLANGRAAVVGVCRSCGTRIQRFGTP